jgi:hypothetical protein
MKMELSIPSLTPRLIVEQVDEAIAFYRWTPNSSSAMH